MLSGSTSESSAQTKFTIHPLDSMQASPTGLYRFQSVKLLQVPITVVPCAMQLARSISRIPHIRCMSPIFFISRRCSSKNHWGKPFQRSLFQHFPCYQLYGLRLLSLLQPSLLRGLNLVRMTWTFNSRCQLIIRIATDSAGASSRGDDIEYAQSLTREDRSEQFFDQHGAIASEMHEVEELTPQT
jgi:hypothetical protein